MTGTGKETSSAMESPLSWSARTATESRNHAELEELINGETRELLHKSTCPNPGCGVRGRRMALHSIWCQFQPVRVLSNNQRVASGQLRLGMPLDSGGGDGFVSFNQSFAESLGLTFDLRERENNKRKIRCTQTGQGIEQSLRYKMCFKMSEFSYIIRGRTGEKKPHRLQIPMSLLKERMLMHYTIKIYCKTSRNNDI
jgi:hypothetical protein